jgi:hypothetical protein
MPVAHRLCSPYGNRTLASHDTTASLFSDSFLILHEIMPRLVHYVPSHAAAFGMAWNTFDHRQLVNERHDQENSSFHVNYADY